MLALRSFPVILSAREAAPGGQPGVIRQREDRDGLQVQVYAGRDPLTGRKCYVSRQAPVAAGPPDTLITFLEGL
jgi:hypothetical protein